MSIYAELGVRTLINAAGTNTVLGGSLMPEPVLRAMADAARSFVTLRELQDRAGERIAELAGVEAALVSSGAAGGITLAAAACLTGADWDAIYRLPDTTGLKRAIVVARSGRPNYMYQAAEHVGARLVQVGSTEKVTPADFAAAIDPETAAVMVVAVSLEVMAARSAESTATVANVAAVARAAGVPLIVDAAAELPPTANLRAFLELGADLVIFSGGKAIRGPQSTGLVLGRRDLVRAAAMNNNPNSAIGRPMKVGKEEIAGLVRALELFVQRDEAAELRGWEATSQRVADLLAGLPGVEAEVKPAGFSARPGIVPCCFVHLPGATAASVDAVVGRLLAGDPAIAVGRFPGGIVVNPMTLVEGEEAAVAAGVARAVQ